MNFPNLFSPITIGTLEIRNRILSTGHDTTLPTDGTVNDALLAYHEARAKGGVGLIVSQVTGVHETARYTSHSLMGVDDGCIPGFRRLADTVHAHGTKLFVQLFHPGREIMESLDGSAPVAYAPSVSPSERFHVIPRALSRIMIADIVAGYGATAARVRKAGVDGVEIVASHGYLPAQFLNPNVNRRDDEYGGAVDRRLRFLREVIAAVRSATGPDFVVGMRISGDEKDPDGLTEETSLDVIVKLAEELDYVNVIAGTSASLGGATHIVPPMAVANAYLAPFAEAVKQRVSIPVMVAGRINQPQEAEAIIASGQADMCGMTRALICDPQMPVKAQTDRSDDIRACIGCNQACIGHFHKGYPISCIQYPESGRERHYGTLLPARVRKKVMVVGGGPGGMKAAAVAAQRGHAVTLYEASSRLGGQALLAQLLPGRSEFGGIVTNLSRELELAGVTVVRGASVDRALIDAECPDVVILATGAKPRWPQSAEISEDAPVVDAWQVLQGQANVGSRVVIADWRCDWVGVGIAELLAEGGRHVRLAVNGLHAGELLPGYVRDMAVARLHRLGVEIIPYARLFGCDSQTVYLQHTSSEEPIIIDDVDTLVLAQGQISECTLLDELESADIALVAIGDCVAARTAEEAVLEGLKAAWTL
ncbi:FAD-dependent oxidoreductase [Granulosicoccus antarcticus]|uniref:NADH oxidase n=1 Tax=Granulosicoccus antarcticus IMCC3135 TaxID=1192854 RepID=A0A2Z2NLL9_9GAMM|nr:FAD-dependent oxidoreductase [Granulosicoccus antarcticus]ASJ72053.1 NADH oxidase [Granulosicoccus antarcticus IMCC3135]